MKEIMHKLMDGWVKDFWCLSAVIKEAETIG